ncbi:uncharacterized protein NEMAJ01_1833 [Nematocida major]|uniref:uncharacterized protein n=1 Tax=Nematocida major TaxID=1912982 RepID=UPI002007E5E4|nr:uncharacterized protein NEMAJ01_1833 [Nematocida major]KAH9386937.1 hypothetical protein NEMAJ01_1833 [Nematocida major]
MKYMREIMDTEKETYLSVVKESIDTMMRSPEGENLCRVFMDGYNAVYLYCTENTHEKYIIEGAEVYKLYDQALIKHLKRLPADYTLETFVRFVDAYIRANEKICRMLSFLSRYFVRVNLEISNANVMELKMLYFERLYSMLISDRENLIVPMFIEGLREYTQMKVKKPLDKSVYYRHLKTLRVMVQSYIRVCEIANKKKSLKKLLNSIAKFAATKKEGESHAAIYYKLAAVDSLFKRKERNKRNLYRMVEEKVDDQVLKTFIEGFVTKMMRSGINKKTHAEISPFYSFIDNSARGKDIFMNTVLMMCVKVIEKTSDCKSLLKFCIFMGKHFSCMPRSSKKVRRVFEMIVARRLHGIMKEPSSAFENDLLESIDTHMKMPKQPVLEMSLFVSCIPAHKPAFWVKFSVGVKNRLILGSPSTVEKRLICVIVRRIEQNREVSLKKNLKLHKTLSDYIDQSTLYNLCESYDVSNFEEILLCIKDVATSEMYFRTAKPEVETECLLLSYTRWNYPIVKMHIPAELEEMWESVKKYCTEKGRKYTLFFCPTVSPVTLHLDETEIECDVIQGSILLLLVRVGPHALEELVGALMVECTEETQALVLRKVQTLKSASLVVEINGKYEICLDSAQKKVGIFVPEIEDVLSENSAAKYAYSRSAIEARIVRILKEKTGMSSEELQAALERNFQLEDQELEGYVNSLQERGLISSSEGLLYFVP